MDDIFFRKATIKDIPFLVDVIIEAEKSGTDRLSYAAIFGLSEQKIRAYLKEMLEEEIDGCGELSVSSYLLAVHKDQPVAAACAWVEGVEELPTSVLKGNLIKYIIPREYSMNAAKLHKLLSELHFDYSPNVIHMGAGYVTQEYRGNNILLTLKKKQLDELIKQHPEINEAFVDTFACSKAALRTSEKLGFKVVEIKEASTDEILNYLPSKKKVFQKLKIK